MKLRALLISAIIVVSIYPQVSDITRFPYQDLNNEYYESSPVVISEDEILIFYCTGYSKNGDYWSNINDTLYFSKSTDGGVNWGLPKFVRELGKPYSAATDWLITSLFTYSGRIILSWFDLSTYRMNLIYSDDLGVSWSDIVIFGNTFGGGHLNLSEVENNRIIFNFDNSAGTRTQYYLSTDNGTTWSANPITFHTGYPVKKNLSFVGLSTKTLVFFEFNNGIYFQESTDDGISWSGEYPVTDSIFREHNPRVVKFSDYIITIYYQVDEVPGNFNYLNDIYLIKTTNGGITWTAPERITSYAGDDSYIQAANAGEESFITFSTTRFTNKPQLCFAKPDETVENFRPPFIADVFAEVDSTNSKKILIKSNIVDDEQVARVNITLEDGSDAELFDDGLHNDGNPNDDLFANMVELNTLSPSKVSIINVNKLTLPIDNKGNIASQRTNFSQQFNISATDNNNEKIQLSTILESYSLRWHYGLFEESVFLFSSGFVLSGISNGETWTNAQASAMLVEDYLPGKVGSLVNDPLNKIYTIYADDIPFGYSWQRWKDAVSLGAEFYDGDNDGVYNPVDKNWNGTWEPDEDMPMIIGEITTWCVFNDAISANRRRWYNVNPQGIEIRQTIFASSNPELENVIFIRYSILNTGTIAEVVDSVYFGIWEDADVGDADDDLVGCDTLLNSGFYYNSGNDFLYGENPPSFATTLLQGPVVNTGNPFDTAKINFGEVLGSLVLTQEKNLDMTSYIFIKGGDPQINDPGDPNEMRCFQLGRNKHCELIDPCSFFYCEVRGGVNCNEVNPLFWASGDPVSDYGWILITHSDERNLINTGPFKLEKNKPQEIIIAYVVGRGTDPLNSITVARENVQRAIQEYQSNFASMTYTAPAATNPVNSYVLYQNYPNPFNPTTKIRYELPQDGKVRIELFDILGQKVRTLVDEFKTADRYEVIVNLSELASGVYIYRMKINDFVKSKKMVFIK